LTSPPAADDKTPREAAVDNITRLLDVDMLMTKGLSLSGSVIAALLILVIGRMAARVVARTLSKVLQHSKTDVTLVKFLYNLVYALMMVFIVMAALQKIGVNTASFVGVVAAAGLAIGLALQGSLSNFAAGVMMILLHHFGIGDSIEAAGQKGRVLDVQIFSTVLLTDDGTRVIIPNNAITSGTVKVFAPPAEQIAEQIAEQPVAASAHAA
jgi:small conductance mechanosensitive channel